MASLLSETGEALGTPQLETIPARSEDIHSHEPPPQRKIRPAEDSHGRTKKTAPDQHGQPVKKHSKPDKNVAAQRHIRLAKKGVGATKNVTTTRDVGQKASFAERYAIGKALRQSCPREAHAEWKAANGRPDAVQLVLQAEKGRLPDLLPLRHGRMVRSAFTFYRGAALTMAYDLASTPSTGVRVQSCGDAHLCNFGGFATPERRIIFSINDLDETLPAPWEWDIKRLGASFVVACRDNGLGEKIASDVVLRCILSYRKSTAEFSQMRTLELWHQALWAEDLLGGIKDPALRARLKKRLAKERGKSAAEEIFPKLTEHKGGMPVIKDQLPTIFHLEGHPPGEVQDVVLDALGVYRASLHSSLQRLFDRYTLRDAAIKVVGIGSVGTMCWVLLFMAGDNDALFLQVKEARTSVLEPYAGASVFPNHGQRVVDGYRLMQPASDMFLGWTRGAVRGTDYFIRQLRDIKVSPRVENFGSLEMGIYATWCGRALALSHARSGYSAMLSGYMGKSDAFEKAIAKFAVAYADQNEKDHAAFRRAVENGKVKATFEDVA
ncbi:MAG: DUF2252 domain-containing protein [Bryobacteraceae bacterium]